MKKIIIAAMAAAAAFTSYGKSPLTLMSYKIHNGVGIDNVTDYNRIGQMIKSHQPDIVAIQEIDSMTTRSESRYVLGEIAETAGMNGYYAPAINFKGGKYGIGLLCKEKPQKIRRFALPGSEESRALIIAEFPDYAFACTHLSLTEADREASIEIINSLAQEYQMPFFIAGDFNAKPDSKFYSLFTKTFSPLNNPDDATFPAAKPNITIDYIMSYIPTDNQVETKQAEVINEPKMSDHRPVIAKIYLH